MCSQRALVRALSIRLVEEVAFRYQGHCLNSLPALFRSVEALSSLVLLFLATRYALLLYACPFGSPFCC